MLPDILNAVAGILGAVAWPIVAGVGIVRHRSDISALLKRLRKGGPAEFDPLPTQNAAGSISATELIVETALPTGSSSTEPTTASQKPNASSSEIAPGPVPAAEPGTVSKALSESLSALPGSPATIAWEERILGLDAVKNITSLKERETVLTRVAARALLVATFERIDGTIYGSQLALLSALNANRQAGMLLIDVKTVYYDPAAKNQPAFYHNYPFENYLHFLQNNALVELAGDGRVRISDQGIEYLGWRALNAKPLKLLG